jgi:hypothetical protein
MSCSRSVDPEPEPLSEYDELKQQIAHSPREDEEAELMALWLRGDVVAFDRDYDAVKNALARVREQFGDSIPQLNSIQFKYQYQEGVVGLILTESAIAQLRAGEYVEWDSLNTLFKVADIDTSRMEASSQVELSFEGRLNPAMLQAYYAKLAGVSSGFLGVWIEDDSNIYPWKLDNQYTFLLREAWGDCLLEFECKYSHFWYFKVIGSTAYLIGDFLVDDNPNWPDWWDEAKEPFCRYTNNSICYIK